jgi:hypothetical protein
MIIFHITMFLKMDFIFYVMIRQLCIIIELSNFKIEDIFKPDTEEPI